MSAVLTFTLVASIFRHNNLIRTHHAALLTPAQRSWHVEPLANVPIVLVPISLANDGLSRKVHINRD
jgi:hypothetical protein